MKKILGIVLICLVLIVSAIYLVYFTKEKKQISDDFKIAGISLDMRKSDVIKVLGEPLKRKQNSEPSFHNMDYTFYTDIWTYEDLDVSFTGSLEKKKAISDKDFSVSRIVIKKGNYLTKRSIKIGDSLKKITEKYGPIGDDGAYRTGLTYINFYVAYDGTSMQIEIGQEFD